ncbi:ribosome biogenesis factor YjgA [Brackiella oedipodis]|uniref:ribosome biogenesis factor YjgA n=1 Tax=Brackiella oedipodis TaxID=124225 RepID=UPI00316ACB37
MSIQNYNVKTMSPYQHSPEEDTDQVYDRPSKSQIKREMHALVDFAKDIIALPANNISQLPLSESCVEAVQTAQKITSREGKRRQTAYVGKLLRDEDVDALKEKISQWNNTSEQQNAHFHGLELLRDRLLENDSYLTQVIEHYQVENIQELRNLIRAARKEQQHNQQLSANQDPQRKAYRALFQQLKTLKPMETNND